ncbi:hypothetical protein F8388_006619 [Cannabis sativa]|nr:hypothetical protein F8388_006619 [Cannabis sativa]
MVSPNRNPAQGFSYPHSSNMYNDLPGINSMQPPENTIPSPTANVNTTSFEVPPTKKIRKPYTITKSRESWSEQEHQKFVEAVQLFGRDWKKIEAFVGTKTAVQIRSHAQKHFEKVLKSGIKERVPPPRPKKKATHPYPHKSPTDAPNVAQFNGATNVTQSTGASYFTHANGFPIVTYMTGSPTVAHFTGAPTFTNDNGDPAMSHFDWTPAVTHVAGSPNVTHDTGPFHYSAALYEPAFCSPHSSSAVVNPINGASSPPWRSSSAPPVILPQLETDVEWLSIPELEDNRCYNSERSEPVFYSQAMRDDGAVFLPAIEYINPHNSMTERTLWTGPASEINHHEVYFSQGMRDYVPLLPAIANNTRDNSSTESTLMIQPDDEIFNIEGFLRDNPSFAPVYEFIANVLEDPNEAGHLQRLRQMDPTRFRSALLMMQRLSQNLQGPNLARLCQIISPDGATANEERVMPSVYPNNVQGNAILSA